jgi:hypothetical protein
MIPTTIENPKVKMKYKKFTFKEVNLKKKRSKQKMQFNRRRKVRLNFSINENYLKKASIIYMFNFFNDMSWPATQGIVEIIKLNNIEVKSQNNIQQQFDMAAGVCLNDQVATCVQTDIAIWKETFIYIILDDSVLTVFLNDQIQSVDRWTNLENAIQILKIIYLIFGVYNLYVSSWHATQCTFLLPIT